MGVGMIQKTNLTVRDYFNQAGIQLRKPMSAPTRPVSANRHPGSFGAIFKTTRNQIKTAQGLTAQDYLANPVRTMQPNRSISGKSPQRAATVIPTPGPSPLSLSPGTAKAPSSAATQAVITNQTTTDIDRQRAIIARSIDNAARRFNVAPALLHAVVKAESDYQVTAVSPVGAQGLMQLMPGTAKELGVSNPFDIEQNIHGGTNYLRRMLDRFDGKLDLALAAYNAGPGTVSRYGNQVPPYAETRAYVERVLSFTRKETA